MKFYFLPMFIGLLLTFGGGYWYRTQINEAPTQKEQAQNTIASLEKDVEAGINELKDQEEDHASIVKELNETEVILKETIQEITEENEQYKENEMTLDQIEKETASLEKNKLQMQIRDKNLTTLKIELDEKAATLAEKEEVILIQEIELKAKALLE